MQNISVFDIIVLVILVFFTLRGGLKGMMSQIVSLVSLFAAWVVAMQGSATVAPMITFVQEPFNRVFALLILFVGTWLGVWFLYRLIAGMFATVKLHEFDRQMGSLLGFGKGLLLCLCITFFAISLDTTRNYVYTSKSGYYLTQILNKAQLVMPADVWGHVQEKLAKFGFFDREPGEYDAEMGAVPTDETSPDGGMFQQFVDTVKETGDTIKQANQLVSKLSSVTTPTSTSPPTSTSTSSPNSVPNSTTTVTGTVPTWNSSSVPAVSESLQPPVRAATPFGGETTGGSGSGTVFPQSPQSSPPFNPRAWSEAIRDGQ